MGSQFTKHDLAAAVTKDAGKAELPICLPCSIGDHRACRNAVQRLGWPRTEATRACRCAEGGHKTQPRQ